MKQSENDTFRFACLNKPWMDLFRPSLGFRNNFGSRRRRYGKGVNEIRVRDESGAYRVIYLASSVEPGPEIS